MKILALITQTLHELSAKATLIVLASISTFIIIGTSLAVSSGSSADGETLMLFGNAITPPTTAENLGGLIRQMQAGMAGGLFAGVILFGVFATAGIVPDTLEKGTVDLYLSKPIARWELLLGRSLGAVAVMLVNILYFIGAIWLLFGLKIGYWNHSLLLAALTMAFVFASLFSIVAFLGVLSRNMAIPIIGAFLYLLIIGSVLESREHGLYLISENVIYRGAIDGLYYLLPQLSAMQRVVSQLITQASVDWKPFVQSILSSALIFGGAAAMLHRKDF